MGQYIANVSFGKDSLAMLLMLIEKSLPLDEVVFFNTGMEFEAIYSMRDKVLPLLAENGIKYTELHPAQNMEYAMTTKLIKGRGGKYHYGYEWCGGVNRWATSIKTAAIDKYAAQQGVECQYVGIAADEAERCKRLPSNKQTPLCDWGMTENDCLVYCFDHGFDWVEDAGRGDVSLYYLLDRVSCWCCANKNLKELRNIYHLMPKYWERLKALQVQIAHPFKGPGKSVFDLEDRFDFEDERREAGLSITDRDFYRQLELRRRRGNV